LRQAAIDPLTDAVPADEAGGDVTIRHENADPEPFLIVEDSGKGIPEENPDKIFDPFSAPSSPAREPVPASGFQDQISKVSGIAG